MTVFLLGLHIYNTNLCIRVCVLTTVILSSRWRLPQAEDGRHDDAGRHAADAAAPASTAAATAAEPLERHLVYDSGTTAPPHHFHTGAAPGAGVGLHQEPLPGHLLPRGARSRDETQRGAHPGMTSFPFRRLFARSSFSVARCKWYQCVWNAVLVR